MVLGMLKLVSLLTLEQVKSKILTKICERPSDHMIMTNCANIITWS